MSVIVINIRNGLSIGHRKDERIDRWMNRQVDGWMDGQVGVWMDEWIGLGVGGWMDGCTDGLMRID